MEWLNEPATWEATGDKISVTADAKTDIWRITHDGEVRDNAHFYYQEMPGDFEASVQFSGKYVGEYDHAGLMVRLDEKTWLKCGIEYFNNSQHVSAVVTRDFSDWSVVLLPDAPAALQINVKRHGVTMVVEYAIGDGTPIMLRQAYLSDAPTLKVGLMCAAPLGDGFPVTFENFTISSI